MSSVTFTALSAMQSAQHRFGEAAGRIASNSGDSDIAQDITDLLMAKRDFEANLLVLRAEDEMFDRLLDIRC
jgi:flagellar hook protein FlgE